MLRCRHLTEVKAGKGFSGWTGHAAQAARLRLLTPFRTSPNAKSSKITECDDDRDVILCAPSSSSCDEDRMKRREFIAATAALLVSPRLLRAEGTPRRVGYLDPVFKNLPLFKVWLDGLRDHGWIEGRT